MTSNLKRQEENKRDRLLGVNGREAIALGMIRYAMEQQPIEQRRDTIAGCLRAAAKHAETARASLSQNGLDG